MQMRGHRPRTYAAFGSLLLALLALVVVLGATTSKSAAAPSDAAAADAALITCGTAQTIGFAAPITGPVAAAGAQMVKWGRFAMTRWNATHPDSQIRLVMGDTQLPDSAQAVRVAESFASNDEMLVVVGPAGSRGGPGLDGAVPQERPREHLRHRLGDDTDVEGDAPRVLLPHRSERRPAVLEGGHHNAWPSPGDEDRHHRRADELQRGARQRSWPASAREGNPGSARVGEREHGQRLLVADHQNPEQYASRLHPVADRLEGTAVRRAAPGIGEEGHPSSVVTVSTSPTTSRSPGRT